MTCNRLILATYRESMEEFRSLRGLLKFFIFEQPFNQKRFLYLMHPGHLPGDN